MKDFDLAELTKSDTAKKLGIDNIPNGFEKDHLFALYTHIIHPLEIALKKEIHVSSGFRSRALNDAVGGSPSSLHLQGKAVDMYVDGMTTEELFQFVIHQESLKFDQCIQEFDQWVHVSYDPDKEVQRRDILRAQHNRDGRVQYLRV